MKVAASKIQALYDKVQSLKNDKAAKVRERKEGLEQIPRYKEIQGEAAKLRESRKSIESEWDQQNDSVVTEIESLKSKIEGAEFTLTQAILDAMRDGHPVEIFKTSGLGEKKKLGFKFKVNFEQTTLGI